MTFEVAPSRRFRPAAMALVAALGLVGLAGCGNDGDRGASDTSSSSPAAGSATTAAASGAGAPACTPEPARAPKVTPVDGVPGDYTMISFDDTAIRLHWYPAKGADGPAPTVMQGPGWSLGGATDTGGSGLFGDLSVASLRAGGYNVLTWDPRAFGASAGIATVNDPAYEGRDVLRMIDWLADQPEAEQDGPGDPRVGMVGGSYGGGIQLLTAAADCRVDAIVPTIAWNSLRTSLYKSDLAKQGWSEVLYGLAMSKNLDSHLNTAIAEARAAGTVSDENLEWFAGRGPGDAVGDIRVPTLLVQGTVDTLFTLDEAVTNYGLLRDAGTPVSMLWYCGGHGVCLSEPGDAEWIVRASVAWLDRYLRDDTSVDLPAGFETVDQGGARWVADAYPDAPSSTIEASGRGELALDAASVAGPAAAAPGAGGAVGSVALAITPAKATKAVDVPLRADADAFVLGAPTLELRYSGTTPAGDRPTRVFAQLVDDASSRVLGNQITPIALDLDGSSHTVSVPLEMVAHRLAAGGTLTLQLVATTPAYAQPRLGGSVSFEQIRVSLPVTGALRKA